MSNEPRYPKQQLFFDPDEHPESTLKAFEEFTQIFDLRYAAQYPDPPKVSMDSAIERWKVANTTATTPNPVPDLNQYDQVRSGWQSRDKVAKLLGMFSSNRLYTDWKVAVPDEAQRKAAGWDDFIASMKDFYKPTANPTLTNYHFRQLVQRDNETFPAFCNRVLKEVKHCNFNCHHANCSAEIIAARDQIVIGTSDSSIRESALKKSWDFDTLRKEGMKMESAARGGAEIAGESLNRLGKYSYRNTQNTKHDTQKRTCYNCGATINGSIMKHKEQCPARGVKCHKCDKKGHYGKVCRQPTSVQQLTATANESNQTTLENETVDDVQTIGINLFHINASKRSVKPKLSSIQKNRDFKVQVLVNNTLDSVIADTGASVSV